MTALDPAHLTAAEVVDRAENGTLRGVEPGTARALIESAQQLERARIDQDHKEELEELEQAAGEEYRRGYREGYDAATRESENEEAKQ